MPCECGALDVMCSMSESRENLNESIKTFTPRSIEMGSVKRLLHLCSVHKSFASSTEAKRRVENSSSECLLENFSSPIFAMQSSVSRNLFAFSVFKSRKINFLNRRNGAKKIFCRVVDKYRESSSKLQSFSTARGDLRYKCLMQQYKAEGISTSAFPIPSFVQEPEDCFESMAE